MKSAWWAVVALVLGLGCSPNLSVDCDNDGKPDCPTNSHECVAGICLFRPDNRNGDGATTDSATPVDDGQPTNMDTPRDDGTDGAPDALPRTDMDTDVNSDGQPPRPDQDAGGVNGDANIGGTDSSLSIDGGQDSGAGGKIPDADVLPSDSMVPRPDQGLDPDASPDCIPTGDETCDGLDNDCDGETDEEFPEQGEPCSNQNFLGICSAGLFTCDGDRGLWCEPQLMPHPMDLCDSLDDDCNGQIDEGFPQLGTPCTVGQGLCSREGRTLCALDGHGTRCDVAPGQASNEVCDNQDNNCNGTTDEGEGGSLTQACYTGRPNTEGVGTCHGGMETCQNGVFGQCQGEILPVEETCDSTDENCDGEMDNHIPGVGMPCNTGLPGVCANGTNSCDAPNHRIVCQSEEGVGDLEEACDNGRDDDCDGATDENCVSCIPLVTTRNCYNGPPGTNEVGECQGGTQTCDALGMSFGSCQGEVLPAEEVCDGLDNNCDNNIDDSLGIGDACTVGQGACQRQGVMECDPETGGTRCTAEAGNGEAETCNGIDDDCDNIVDEAQNGGPLTQACYTGRPNTEGVGTCHGGMETCQNGTFIGAACVGQVIPVLELCNTEDEDCDGTPDDEFNVGDDCSVGQGICQANGRYVCNPDGGDTHCDATPGDPEDEICDGQDNNCNGQIDEGLLNRCGQCGPLPREVCGNEIDDDCDGNVDNGTPEVCDGVDNDCDGFVNEGFNNPPGSDPQCWGRDKDEDGVFSCSFGSDIEEIDARPGEERGWWRRVPVGGLAIGCDCDDNSQQVVNLCPP